MRAALCVRDQERCCQRAELSDWQICCAHDATFLASVSRSVSSLGGLAELTQKLTRLLDLEACISQCMRVHMAVGVAWRHAHICSNHSLCQGPATRYCSFWFLSAKPLCVCAYLLCRYSAQVTGSYLLAAGLQVGRHSICASSSCQQ